MAFEKKTWRAGERVVPQLTAAELNRLEDGIAEASGESSAVTAADITDASTVGRTVLTAVDAAAARTAIGAGTSSLTLAQSQAGIATKTQIAALSANATANAAASVAEPTKAEFDAVVALANSLKTTLNAVIAAMKA